ncbi:hypothetical protein JZ785_27560 (plasmid) [Alicyclobacillus curvatus]|nr:hypothetical protein JZ785_27560 [Alicyclobacillus curvatus]
MSSAKDEERMKRKMGMNPAAAAFVSPFVNNDSNNASNNNIDNNDNIQNDMNNNSNKDVKNNITNDVNHDIENDIENDNNNIIASNNDINNAINNDNNTAIDDDIANDIDNEIAVAQESPTSTIDALLDGTGRKPTNKVFKGFYLDPDVAKILDKLAKKHGKGIQSQIVNETLRMVFMQKNLL